MRESKQVALLLFIDFRKAFDLVDSRKLLRKLFHYGFDNTSLDLVANYFSDRSQSVKYNFQQSQPLNIRLGVPQGSVLGPLFFLIYINDLAFMLSLNCKMFADDTTLYDADEDINKLMLKFTDKLKPFIEWCKYNKLDINWSKTFFMIITDRRIKKRPKEITVQDVPVTVVDNFKLLGVTIDNQLSFTKFSSEVKSAINKKLYAIKRLFYLATSVKIQFFKTFLLPYFDYCLSLLIYFPKTTIQSLSNCFNSCLFKLFKFSLETSINTEEEEKEEENNTNLNNFNNKLNAYGLFSFQHRLMNKILTFINNTITNTSSPIELKKTLAVAQETAEETNNNIYSNTLSTTNDKMTLRSGRIVDRSQKFSKHTQNTFTHFTTKIFLNFQHLNFYNQKPIFKSQLQMNTNTNINIFLNTFPKFNITYSNISISKRMRKKQL